VLAAGVDVEISAEIFLSLMSHVLLFYCCVRCVLVEEDFAGDDPKEAFTAKYCSNLVKNAYPTAPIPTECQKYPDVVMSLQRRESQKHDQTVAFAGMSPGEKASAMAARDKGRLSQAQIKRRLTSPTSKHNSWWA
jgi:hypothetical protein